MRILVDTNVILRLSDKAHAMYSAARSAVDQLDAHGDELVIVPQVLYEYWVVATRPLESNGLGMAVAAADAGVSEWMAVFRLLLDERGVFPLWRDLIVRNDVKGKNAHDARLVAAMQRHELTRLLSFNKQDFVRYSAIQVVTPTEVLAGLVSQ